MEISRIKAYWPLAAIILVFLAIFGMSYDANYAKRHYENAQTDVKAAPVAKDANQKAQDHTAKPYKPPIWADYVTFPEGLGAWAIVLTLLAIVWQAIETRKSADAARDSIRLQEFDYIQWVELTEWENVLTDLIPHHYTGLPIPQRLCISAQIANKTNYPLILKDSILNFGEGATGTAWYPSKDAFIAPKSSVEVTITLDMANSESLNRYSRNEFMVPVRGKLSFEGILKRRETQPVGGILVCTRTDTKFIPIMPGHPQTNNQRDSQHPN